MLPYMAYMDPMGEEALKFQGLGALNIGFWFERMEIAAFEGWALTID